MLLQKPVMEIMAVKVSCVIEGYKEDENSKFDYYYQGTWSIRGFRTYVVSRRAVYSSA